MYHDLVKVKHKTFIYILRSRNWNIEYFDDFRDRANLCSTLLTQSQTSVISSDNRINNKYPNVE